MKGELKKATNWGGPGQKQKRFIKKPNERKYGEKKRKEKSGLLQSP